MQMPSLCLFLFIFRHFHLMSLVAPMPPMPFYLMPRPVISDMTLFDACRLSMSFSPRYFRRRDAAAMSFRRCPMSMLFLSFADIADIFFSMMPDATRTPAPR